MTQKVETTLQFAKETKGTVVFKNDTPNAPIPSLYVKKGTFETVPSEIKLTIEAQ